MPFACQVLRGGERYGIMLCILRGDGLALGSTANKMNKFDLVIFSKRLRIPRRTRSDLPVMFERDAICLQAQGIDQGLEARAGM